MVVGPNFWDVLGGSSAAYKNTVTLIIPLHRVDDSTLNSHP